MVGNRCAVDTTAVTRIHDQLAALGTSRLLSVDAAGRCMRINLWSLTWQVRRIVAEHTHGLRAERAALWALLKDRVRAVITLAQENTKLYLEWLDLSAEFARVRAERDELAEVSAQREDEIQALRFEVEQLLAGGGER